MSLLSQAYRPENLPKYNPRLAEKLGVRRLLGAGHEGAVFSLENGNVLKVQQEPGEALVAERLERLRRREWTKSSGLPLIFSVRKIHDAPRDAFLYAYEREDLADLPEWLRWYGPLLERTVLLCTTLTNQVRVKKGLQPLNDHDVTKLSPYSREPDFLTALKQIERTLKLVVAADIAPKDAHNANWGVRSNGELVLRDFGQFTIY
jgi:hypothetical protein